MQLANGVYLIWPDLVRHFSLPFGQYLCDLIITGYSYEQSLNFEDRELWLRMGLGGGTCLSHLPASSLDGLPLLCCYAITAHSKIVFVGRALLRLEPWVCPVVSSLGCFRGVPILHSYMRFFPTPTGENQ